MMIPKLHYRSQGNSPAEHLENIQKACTSGIELVRLDLPERSEKKVLKIARKAREITAHFQTRLLIDTHYKVAKEIKADGVHLSSKSVSPALVRKHLYPWQMLGATAHTLEECELLLAEEVDYISLGPYRNSATQKSDLTELGIAGYTLITEALNTETPLLAFGGITTEDVKELLAAGVSGIVVGDAITKDFNSIRTFNQLLNASVTEEQRHSFE
ncbi:thiamine phosphate synthase [Flavimarina sp. Hel_I_48]|uniref:thiamine phosphate synthase n=1 Tax=Flavimarina sp. Hel_I_48 TaxID=1392488 RepID=UPI00055DD40A|nr:thiamine phosphate synthase [Flavimarina sp. Hel_I_48]